MNFHHPYHFVPFDEMVQGIERDTFAKGELKHVTHDRYVEKTHSGRIICRLQTETPVFVGARRDGSKSPVEVENYTLNGQIAIPASSLRGLVSSLAEAASNSALRVMNAEARYSVRKPLDPEHVLSAIGVVLKDSQAGWCLQPICVPTMRSDRDGNATLPKEYWDLFPEPNLKVYIGNYQTIRRDNFGYRTIDFSAPQWYALPLERRTWLPGYRLADDQYQHRKPVSSRMFVLGQRSLQPGLEPVAMNEVSTRVGEEHRENCILGAARVLGCWGNREDSIPTGKKHELFLPWPQRPDWPVVKLPDEVREDFEMLANARMDASLQGHERDQRKTPLLPFEPKDTRQGREGKGVEDSRRKIELRHGDLVYFAAGTSGTITEISYSAIWRKWVRKDGRPARAREFFPSELNPFSPGRKKLTGAELLFGFVENIPDDSPEKRKRSALALASRVHFSAALPEGRAELLSAVTLKVLDSPKPPCPSLYFKPRANLAGAFIGKMQLNGKDHQAQGRKYYLHQPAKGEPWKSRYAEANKDQQSSVRPIASGEKFYFHLDFDNLSDEELGLLLYALCPSEGFRHKIGMGKGIGLGSVNVSPLALLRIDRKKRYTPGGLSSGRYHEVLLASEETRWPSSHELEKATLADGVAGKLYELRDRYRNGMNPQIRQAIELIGEPRYVVAPVLPPMLQDQNGEPEKETFQWFVANETGKVDANTDQEILPQKQFLKPLNDRKDLPVFTQPAWQPRRRR